ncbi:MAG: hypothetical protein ACKV1O_13345 [Saprospiraceae bacterium]
MNAENFREYLNDPSLLYQVPYEELKSLALEYPYNAHLRWLLLQKSRMEHRPDARKLLEKAAVYSIDRRALYHFIQTQYEKSETPFFVFNEDFLELKDLAALREELPAPVEDLTITRPIAAEPVSVFREPPVVPKTEEIDEDLAFDFTSSAVPMMPVEATIPVAPITPEVEQELTSDAAFIVEPELVDVPEPGSSETAVDEIVWDLTPATEAAPEEPLVQRIATDAAVLSNIVEYRATLAAVEAVLERAAHVAPTVAPLPKATFRSWPRPTLAAPVSVQAETPAPPSSTVHPEKKSKKAPDMVAEIARLSVTENAALASETLADLLAAQQLYDKAAKMYERLIMKFPEKSAYFAAKIEKLKKK